jgi:hypothetical protein
MSTASRSYKTRFFGEIEAVLVSSGTDVDVITF